MSTVPTSGPMARVDPDAHGRAAVVPPRIAEGYVAPTRPGAQERERRPFYDLERWSKYNDLLLVVGFLVVVGSVAFIWPRYTIPGAGVLFGAGMMKLAWMLGQAKQ